VSCGWAALVIVSNLLQATARQFDVYLYIYTYIHMYIYIYMYTYASVLTGDSPNHAVPCYLQYVVVCCSVLQSRVPIHQGDSLSFPLFAYSTLSHPPSLPFPLSVDLSLSLFLSLILPLFPLLSLLTSLSLFSSLSFPLSCYSTFSHNFPLSLPPSLFIYLALLPSLFFPLSLFPSFVACLLCAIYTLGCVSLESFSKALSNI